MAYQFSIIFWEVVYGEVEEEGGIEAGFVVCAVQLKHIISTCDRIAGHCWCVCVYGRGWRGRGGGVEGSHTTDGSTQHNYPCTSV